jgi:D-alanyl-D-alanine carboxypeptidase
LDHTTYTDPSGFDPGTVSTAADQLRVFEQAMHFLLFRQIVSAERDAGSSGHPLLLAPGPAGSNCPQHNHYLQETT